MRTSWRILKYVDWDFIKVIGKQVQKGEILDSSWGISLQELTNNFQII